MGVTSAIKNFVIENFWLPVTGRAGGYNIFNTTFYATGFALAAAYIGFPLLKRLDLDLDKRFFIGITPYIFFGGALRVLEDRAIVDSVLFVTPFIYFLMFFLTIGLLGASIYLFNKRYYRYFGATGVLLFVATVSFYGFSNLIALPLVLAIFGSTIGFGYIGLRQFRPDLLTYSFTLPVAAHYWDASTTVTALSFGAEEKHVLASFFVDIMGPAGMFAMKTLIIVPAVYYIDQETEGEKKRYYLFLIALLGAALGTRNILSVMSA